MFFIAGRLLPVYRRPEDQKFFAEKEISRREAKESKEA